MDLSKIKAGENPPIDINAVIEIPHNGGIKYELDKDSGAIFVDRFLSTPMVYPCNYGFIPNSLSDDGDAADVLVVCPFALPPGSVIRCRPVGVLLMSDEAGLDEKIVAVAHSKMTGMYDGIKEATDLPDLLLHQIRHFFEHYKDLEEGKWVKVDSWKDCASACVLIEKAISAYNG